VDLRVAMVVVEGIFMRELYEIFIYFQNIKQKKVSMQKKVKMVATKVCMVKKVKILF
jgi:hypothetical protein